MTRGYLRLLVRKDLFLLYSLGGTNEVNSPSSNCPLVFTSFFFFVSKRVSLLDCLYERYQELNIKFRIL